MMRNRFQQKGSIYPLGGRGFWYLFVLKEGTFVGTGTTMPFLNQILVGPSMENTLGCRGFVTTLETGVSERFFSKVRGVFKKFFDEDTSANRGFFFQFIAGGFAS
jgi:hypothetical protein